MQLACNESGDRVEAEPGAKGTCPSCRSPVIAKCGELVVWHWAHKSKDCDPWAESESRWHSFWKRLAYPDCREVTIGPHRADIKSGDRVIELQHSSISSTEIRKREEFYGNMVWIVDGSVFLKNFSIRPKEGYVTFRWKHPHKGWFAATKPIYIDFGSGCLLEVKKLHAEVPCGGWGLWRDAGVVAEELLGSDLTGPAYYSVEETRGYADRVLLDADRIDRESLTGSSLPEHSVHMGFQWALRNVLGRQQNPWCGL
jgi:hypothetical protein